MAVLEQLIHFTPNSEVIPAKFLESTPASPPPTSALTPHQAEGSTVGLALGCWGYGVV